LIWWKKWIISKRAGISISAETFLASSSSLLEVSLMMTFEPARRLTHFWGKWSFWKHLKSSVQTSIGGRGKYPQAKNLFIFMIAMIAGLAKLEL
jgi:hypothetical protein